MRVRVAVLVAVGLLAFTACSGSTTEPPATTVEVTVPEIPAPQSESGGDGTGYTPGIVTATTVVSSGMRERATLSSKCNQALGPAREVLRLIKAGQKPSGADGSKLAESMRAAETACTPDEYVVFQTKELEPALAGG